MTTNHPIPNAALDNHLAILGKTGSGKTYAAKGMIEGLLDRSVRVCVVDPTGVYFGMRSKYKIPVFGGEHADIQLGSAHGDAIAEVIATSDTSSIIDTSGMRVGERSRFFKDFAETLLRKNKTTLHLIIDEAHLFAPQGKVADPLSGAMLHAANNLVSLGRSKGLRITLISQRPAKLHKDSLSQIESLIAMRLTAPQDRDAVKAWIADQADVQVGKDIIADLPNVATGQGWLWSPGLNILEKVKFPKIKTFDSSSASNQGATAKLLPINLNEIQGKLAAIGDEIVKNDPSFLKKKIAALEKQVGERNNPWADQELQIVKDKSWNDGFAEGHIQGHDRGYSDGKRDARAEVVSWINSGVPDVQPRVVKKMTFDQLEASKKPGIIMATPDQDTIKLFDRTYKPIDKSKENHHTEYGGDLSGPEQKIVKAIGFWNNIGYEHPTRDMVAGVAGYSPTSGGYQGFLSKMKEKGIIIIPTAGAVSLAGSHRGSMTRDEAKEMLLSLLSESEKKLVKSMGAEAITRKQLAIDNGYSPTSGGYQGWISHLIKLKILNAPAQGSVILTDWATEIFL